MTKHTPKFTQPQLPFDEIPYGYCHCGCGQKTTIAKFTYTKSGIVKGDPRRFISGHYLRTPRTPQQRRTSLADRFWVKVDKRGPDECWEWQGPKTKDGYGRLGGLDLKYITTHRAAWILAHGDIPDGMQVLHTCDNPPCVNIRHLYLGTPAENGRDKRVRGRARGVKGSKHPSAKLTENQVRKIRKLYAPGNTTIVALAEQFGVTWGNIGHIINRRSWTHIR